MGLKKKILHLVLSFLSIFLFFSSKKKNRVTFISLTTGGLKDDFKLIVDELSKDESIEIVTILTEYKKNILGNFMYFCNCIKQLFVINSSRVVVINDNNYVISEFKKSFPTVIQIWHACGAVKKFGNEIKREYPIRNYDIVLSTSDYWKPVYSKSFGVKEKQVIPLGMARTDILCESSEFLQMKQDMIKKYPLLKDKYVVLYAPTFRGNIIKGMTHIPIDLLNIMKQLPENFVILYKMHPLLGDVDLGVHERIINMNNENLYGLFSVIDCLVTDYSSIVFDFSLTNKKQVYYIPDVEEYRKTIGLNLDFNDLPGKQCMNENELIEELKNTQDVDTKKIEEFKHLYFKYTDGKSTERIASMIKDIIKGVENNK